MTLIVATGNRHKADEISRILKGAFQVQTLKDIGFTDSIVEDGATFEDNAWIKVNAVKAFLKDRPMDDLTPVFLLADDSGIEVAHLKGAPGVISARYAGEPCNDEANNRKLLEALKGVPGHDRQAQFRCVLALETDDGTREVFIGVCPGKIGFEPKGSHGFGYDPIFFPDGFCKTYAELTSDEKNQVSHRAKALSLFRKWIDARISFQKK